jgi:hypothetical protein
LVNSRYLKAEATRSAMDRNEEHQYDFAHMSLLEPVAGLARLLAEEGERSRARELLQPILDDFPRIETDGICLILSLPRAILVQDERRFTTQSFLRFVSGLPSRY